MSLTEFAQFDGPVESSCVVTTFGAQKGGSRAMLTQVMEAQRPLLNLG